MPPDIHDVQQLVTALFTVNSSLEQARRNIPQASQITVLQVIAANPGINPKAIAAELDRHPSSITRQIRALEDVGYVAVVVNQEDRRSCVVTLTEAGQHELERLMQIGLNRFAAFVAAWDPEEVRTLARLLMKLEKSKAAVASQETRPTGRRWQHES